LGCRTERPNCEVWEIESFRGENPIKHLFVTGSQFPASSSLRRHVPWLTAH
jgi:hypothetical protein